MVFVKKSKIAIIIGIAVTVTVIATVGVVSITAHRNNSGSPTIWDEAVSGYTKSDVRTEKETIRTEIKAHYRKRLDEIMSELKAKGQNEEIMFDAEGQVAYEKADAAADVLKKHHKIDQTFSFESVDHGAEHINEARNLLIECAKAACEVLNHPDSITVREEVILEMFLEEGYYAIKEYGGQEDLLKEIEKTVNLPF